MTEICQAAPMRPAPLTAARLTSVIPAQFREAVERHERHLIALSAALTAAGVTPVMAAQCVDEALASFRSGLMQSIAQLDDAQ